MNVISEKISDGIEVFLHDLPTSITPAVKAKTILSLIRLAIPLGASFAKGTIGGVCDATLKIAGDVYKLKYSLVALRAITALEIYSDAIKYIEYKTATGELDQRLADETITFIREVHRKSQRSWLGNL